MSLSERRQAREQSRDTTPIHLKVPAASILALVWLTALVLGTVLLLHVVERQTPMDAVLLETAPALSKVGSSARITGPDLPWPGKAMLIVIMWLGRLEIVLVLLATLRSGLPTKRQ